MEFSAIQIAVRSGVDVRIMVPKIPDKHAVYLATLSYLKEMVEMGVKVYFYDGFLHSKTMIVDNNKLSIGSCNMDNRSFALNFEDTVLIYSKKYNDEFVKLFEKDIESSVQAELDYFNSKFHRQIDEFIFFHSPHLCGHYTILNEILLRNMK